MIHRIERIQNSAGWKSAARFAVVGALGTLIDVGLFSVFHLAFGLPILLANTLSYSAGIINNFFLHRYWTFSGRSRRAMGVQFAQFAAVSLTALAVNDLLVFGLSAPFGAALSNPAAGALLAKAAATGIGLVWNYLANTWWTFRKSVE
jgi:putative flippase GtrA